MKVVKRVFSLVFISILFPMQIFAQRGRYYADSENFNWQDFNGVHFIFAGLICGILIAWGIKIRYQAKGKILSGVGTALIVIGCLGVLGEMGSPIFAALEILWQIGIGTLVLFGIVYWAYKEYVNDEGIEMISGMISQVKKLLRIN